MSAWETATQEAEQHQKDEAAAEAFGLGSFADVAQVLDRAEAARPQFDADHEPTFVKGTSVQDALDSNFRVPPTREEELVTVAREAATAVSDAVDDLITPELRAARLEAQQLRDAAFVTAFDGLPDVDDETSQQFVESVARGIAEFGDQYRDQVIAHALLVEQGIDPEIGLTPEEWAEFLSDPEVQERIASFETAVAEIPRDANLARTAALEVGIKDTTSKLYLAATAAALSELPGLGFEIPAAKMGEAVARAKNALEMHPDLMDAFGVPSIEWLDSQEPAVFAEILASTIATVYAFQKAQETREIGQGIVDRTSATDISTGMSGGTFTKQEKQRVPLSPDIVLKDLAEQHAARSRVTQRDVAASLARGVKRAEGIEAEKTGLFRKAQAAAAERARRYA